MYHSYSIFLQQMWIWQCMVFQYRVWARNQGMHSCCEAVSTFSFWISHLQLGQVLCFLVPLDRPTSRSLFQHTGSACWRKPSQTEAKGDLGYVNSLYQCILEFLLRCILEFLLRYSRNSKQRRRLNRHENSLFLKKFKNRPQVTR